jgi:L-seryl-tRNA(Ser) seleniumtransferase
MSENCGKLPPDNPHRHLPGVDALLKQCPELLASWGHEQLTAALRAELASLRARIDAGEQIEISPAGIRQAVANQLELDQQNTLKAVFNLTGTVLHTNLGRASLPEEAIDAVVCAARYPSNLEFDLNTGKRGKREDHIASLLCELTGAEAATAVNNNAAAVLLVLNTLALGKQVPVSRGELVEIGGSFRIPEVMQRAGCTLLEIGATNRTHLKDYQRAITLDTALLLKVHTSNYRVEGFTSEVNESELAALANKHGLPFVIDLGSGNLIDFSALGLPKEQTAADAINNGADLITFSGDKLLGGPQAGLIAGRADLIAQINNNPLKRALRLDKMTLAALAEVLKLYRNPQTLPQRLPTLRQLTRPLTDIQALAQRLQQAVAAAVAPHYAVDLVSSCSQIGSGALPVDTLPSASLQLRPTDGDDARLRHLAAALRGLPRPVIGRMHKGALLLDLRCLEDEAGFIDQLPQWGAALA